MLDLFYILTTENLAISFNFSESIVTWLALILISTIFMTIFLLVTYRSSKNPKKWFNESSLNLDKNPGILGNLSSSIRSDKELKKYNNSIKNTILMMFFKKIENSKNISSDQLIDMKNNDINKLKDIIKDEEIIKWISNLDKKETDKSKRFENIRKINKKRFLEEINFMLDKMEAWDK